MRLLALALCACAIRKPPAELQDALCLGVAGYATAADVASQLDGKTIPRVDLDVSQCIDLAFPITCEEKAKADAWTAWSAGAVVALEAAATSGVAAVSIPAVEIAECPAE